MQTSAETLLKKCKSCVFRHISWEETPCTGCFTVDTKPVADGMCIKGKTAEELSAYFTAANFCATSDNKVVYYPIVRWRNLITKKYIEEQVKRGVVGYSTPYEAEDALYKMDTDDSDYEVCAKIYGEWHAVRGGAVAQRKFV